MPIMDNKTGSQYFTAEDINSKSDLIDFFRRHNNGERVFICVGDCNQRRSGSCNHYDQFWEKVAEIIGEKEFDCIVELDLLCFSITCRGYNQDLSATKKKIKEHYAQGHLRLKLRGTSFYDQR